MNTDFPLKAQDAIIGDVIIYPEMDMSRTVLRLRRRNSFPQFGMWRLLFQSAPSESYRVA